MILPNLFWWHFGCVLWTLILVRSSWVLFCDLISLLLQMTGPSSHVFQYCDINSNICQHLLFEWLKKISLFASWGSWSFFHVCQTPILFIHLRFFVRFFIFRFSVETTGTGGFYFCVLLHVETFWIGPGSHLLRPTYTLNKSRYGLLFKRNF